MLKPHTTHSRTLPNETKVDVFKLIILLKNRTPILVNISDIQNPSKGKSHGFSEIRLNDADISFPIIIDETGFIIDGRHRLLKLIEGGEQKVKVLIAAKNDLRNAAYTTEEELISYQTLLKNTQPQTA